MIGQIAFVSITAGLACTFAVFAHFRHKRVLLTVQQDTSPVSLVYWLRVASGVQVFFLVFRGRYTWLSALRDIG